MRRDRASRDFGLGCGKGCLNGGSRTVKTDTLHAAASCNPHVLRLRRLITATQFLEEHGLVANAR